MRGWLAGAAVVVATVVTACRDSERSATDLHVRLFTAYSTVRNYSVRCDPDGGTVKNPRRVCAAVTRTPALVRFHSGIDHSCPCCRPAVHVSGIAAERKVAVTFAPCKTGQEEWARRWTRLVGYA